ncbi:hypothetical protein RI054_08g45850 [Pseudoscourfieldia marina]
MGSVKALRTPGNDNASECSRQCDIDDLTSSFRHGTGSAGEQRPEQPLLNDEEREDLVVIAQNSPLASQRLSARRALLDDATLRHQQMEETTTATASSPGMRVLVARARRERDMAQQALDNEQTTSYAIIIIPFTGSESPTPTPPLQQRQMETTTMSLNNNPEFNNPSKIPFLRSSSSGEEQQPFEGGAQPFEGGAQQSSGTMPMPWRAGVEPPLGHYGAPAVHPQAMPGQLQIPSGLPLPPMPPQVPQQPMIPQSMPPGATLLLQQRTMSHPSGAGIPTTAGYAQKFENAGAQWEAGGVSGSIPPLEGGIPPLNQFNKQILKRTVGQGGAEHGKGGSS